MSKQPGLELNLDDPQSLEAVYRKAVREKTAGEFASEMARLYTASPGNSLLAAWHFRLQEEPPVESQARQIPWRLVIPLSLALSLIYWLLSSNMGQTLSSRGSVDILIQWAPVTAAAILLYLAVISRSVPRVLDLEARTAGGRAWLTRFSRELLVVVALVAVTVYASIQGAQAGEPLRTLLLLHLPILSALAVGIYMVRPIDDENSFAALHKGMEIVLTGGILVGAGLVFVTITMGLFGALGIQIAEPIRRWLMVGVPGLFPVIAVALSYDPALAPVQQRFDQGFSKLVFTVARLFLAPAILVGAFYLASIPANFFKPFEQRDVLIVYNVMLFAVIALLCFATPLHESDVPERWRRILRWGLVIVAAMAVLISVYALSATVYRTWLGGLTMNRLTIIGWNVLNIAILCLFLFWQARTSPARWISSSHRAYFIGMIGYGVWSLFVVLVIPVLFR